MASTSASRTTPTERSSSTRPARPPGATSSTRLSGSAVSGPTAPAPVPGLQAKLASVTVMGLWSRSSGYERSSSETSSLRAVEPATPAPLDGRTTSSCQPSRSR